MKTHNLMKQPHLIAENNMQPAVVAKPDNALGPNDLPVIGEMILSVTDYLKERASQRTEYKKVRAVEKVLIKRIKSAEIMHLRDIELQREDLRNRHQERSKVISAACGVMQKHPAQSTEILQVLISVLR